MVTTKKYSTQVTRLSNYQFHTTRQDLNHVYQKEIPHVSSQATGQHKRSAQVHLLSSYLGSDSIVKAWSCSDNIQTKILVSRSRAVVNATLLRHVKEEK